MKKILTVLVLAMLVTSVFATEWRVSDHLTFNDKTGMFTNVDCFKNINIEDFKYWRIGIDIDGKVFLRKARVPLDCTFRVAELPRTLEGLNPKYKYVEWQGDKYIKEGDIWYSDKSIYQSLISCNRVKIGINLYNLRDPGFSFLEKDCKELNEPYLCDKNPDNIITFYQDEKTYQEAKKDIESVAKNAKNTNALFYCCKDKQVAIVQVDNTIVVRTWNK